MQGDRQSPGFKTPAPARLSRLALSGHGGAKSS